MNRSQVRETIIRMLSAETGCEPEQLTDGRVHVVTRKPERESLPDHRRFNPHPGRIGAVTLGEGAVIAVDPPEVEWGHSVFDGLTKDQVFRDEPLAAVIARGKKLGLTVHGPYPRFTGTAADITDPQPAPGYTVRVIDIEDELARGNVSVDRLAFPNALFPQTGVSGRPTVIAAVAETDGKIVGIAGVSKDSDFMCQVGIDVLAEHRGNGLAPAMTAAAARAVFGFGALPYYGTSSSNIYSMRTALAAGLRPTWVEVLTRPA